jgi:hypothetical protein
MALDVGGMTGIAWYILIIHAAILTKRNDRGRA